MIYKEIFNVLNKYKIRYVVVGGVAVLLHGFERFTKDLDLMVDLDEKNLAKIYEAFKKIGYKPKVPVTKEQFMNKKERKKWQKEKGMIVFSFVKNDPPFYIVDMFVDEPIPFSAVYKNRINIHVEKVKIPLISMDHLRILKQKAGRAQDLIDLVQLNAIKEMK